jgi:uncharacterized protein (TIGR00297 family)
MLFFMSAFHLLLFTILIAAVVASVSSRKLTVLAGITGAFVAVILYKGAGFAGVILMAVFFMLGTLATSHQLHKKRKLGLAESNKGRRNAFQVLANAGVATIAALAAVVFPSWSAMMLLLVAASFSSATADTLSSELGNVYGRSFYNVTTFRKDKGGLDGVISLEGTLWGVGGSMIIGMVYCIFTNSFHHFWIIVAAGTIGNLADSIIGSALERKGRIKNNAVNFLNTLIAAVIALLIYVLR